jgi:hypothetical protein
MFKSTPKEGRFAERLTAPERVSIFDTPFPPHGRTGIGARFASSFQNLKTRSQVSIIA